MGLLVAALTGLLTGLGAFEVLDTVTAASIVKLLVFTVGIVAKDALLFLKDHPVDAAINDAPKPNP